MSEHRPYSGLVEALTMEEAATRCRVGLDHFKKHYNGRIVRIGANVRVSAADLSDWLDGLGAGGVESDPWAGVGERNAEESTLSRRKSGQAA